MAREVFVVVLAVVFISGESVVADGVAESKDCIVMVQRAAQDATTNGGVDEKEVRAAPGRGSMVV